MLGVEALTLIFLLEQSHFANRFTGKHQENGHIQFRKSEFGIGIEFIFEF